MQLITLLPRPAARALLKLGYQAATVWWHIRRPVQQGVMVALHHGDRILMLRQSYQPR